MSATDWRLDCWQADELRGATFVRVAWSPPPAEWVAVHRDEYGLVQMVSLRSAPREPGWVEGEYPVWDHDHCALCTQRLTDNPEYEDGESVGYRAGDNPGEYEWVCESCFRELHDQLDWKAASA